MQQTKAEKSNCSSSLLLLQVRDSEGAETKQSVQESGAETSNAFIILLWQVFFNIDVNANTDFLNHFNLKEPLK